MVNIMTQHYNNGLNKQYSHATMHYIYKCDNGTFTIKEARQYISYHSIYGIRGYLFDQLKEKALLFGLQNQTMKPNTSTPIKGLRNND